MNHVFVWTIDGVITAALLGVVALFILYVTLDITYHNIKAKIRNWIK